MKRKFAPAALHFGVVLASIALAGCSSPTTTEGTGASGGGVAKETDR